VKGDACKFDPYLQWFKIPTDQRPPNHYQLLEISPGEASNPVAVHAAVERRSDQLLRHTSGPNAEECVRIAAEIDTACKTLLDPELRCQYDTSLKRLDGVRTAKKARGARRAAADAPISPSAAIARAQASGNGVKSSRRWFLPVACGVTCFFVLVGGTLGYFVRQPRQAGDTSVPTLDPAASSALVSLPPSPDAPRILNNPWRVPRPQVPAEAVAVAPTPAPARRVRPPEPKIIKLTVPNAAALELAEKKHKDKYRVEYQSLRTSEDYLTLAAKFLQPGREDRKNPAAWYVLLREARDLAARAERPRLAIEAITEIDKWFIVDPIEMALTVMIAMATPAAGDKTPLAGEARAKTFVSVALGRVGPALKADNYEAAAKFLALAEQILNRSPHPDQHFAEAIATRRAELRKWQNDYQAVVAARIRLKEAPNDPAANVIVGIHLACNVGKWDEGLQLLARGNYPPLKRIAEAELDRPSTVKGQLRIADFWWTYARRTGGRGEIEEQQHAAHWYEKAVEQLQDSPERERANDHIEEVRQQMTAGGIRLTPGSFQGRDTENRILLLREGGGTMETEEAVERGLQWLAAHQSQDGRWQTEAFFQAAGCNCTDPGRRHETAATAFGVLPMLAAGNTHRQGRYRRSVEAGLAYLIHRQQPNGDWGEMHEFNHYESALASLCLFEAFGMTKDPALQIPALKAINYIIQSQSPLGGWGYEARSMGPDMSVTVWQILALKTAIHAGLYVPKDTFDPMVNFIDRVADRDTPGYWYLAPGTDPREKGPRPSLMPDGLLCRELLGWASEKRGLTRTARFLAKIPVNGMQQRPAIYYMHFSRKALHHFGGPEWEEWNTKTRPVLLTLQDKGDEYGHEHRKGSWSPVNEEWMHEGGRIMATSMAVLGLEVYYSAVSINGFGSAVLND
jgi:hypothetical protein